VFNHSGNTRGHEIRLLKKLARNEVLSLSSIILWGIGNPLFGDDGVGPFVADALRKEGLQRSITAINCETMPENYVADLRRKSPNTLLIIDAADMNLAPGSLRRIPFDMVENISFSTHGLPLGMLLGDLVQKISVIYIGIQPSNQDLGAPISNKVKKAAQELLVILGKEDFESIPLLHHENLSPK